MNNGVGGRNNYFYMHETMPSPFAMRRAAISDGALTSHVVETKWLRDDYEREIHLYRPPVKESVPLLFVFYGQHYLHRGKLLVIFDNLYRTCIFSKLGGNGTKTFIHLYKQ